MAIMVDHILVPVKDPVAGARGLAELLDLPWQAQKGHFSPVYVGEVTFDFSQSDDFRQHHFCFHVTDAEFDGIMSRIRARNIPYRTKPYGDNDMQVRDRAGGRNVYWEDADGHLWELVTESYSRMEESPDLQRPAAAR